MVASVFLQTQNTAFCQVSQNMHAFTKLMIIWYCFISLSLVVFLTELMELLWYKLLSILNAVFSFSASVGKTMIILNMQIQARVLLALGLQQEQSNTLICKICTLDNDLS